MRRFVIGDIHGCMKSLRTLIEEISPTKDDTLIFLGDYVDRGPDSRDVVDQLVALQSQCNFIGIRGNHEIMLMGVVGGLDPAHWLASGGLSTLTSYGGSMERIPDEHLSFFRSLKPYHETDKEIFVHACYQAHVPMNQQHEEFLYWQHLGPLWPGPHHSGKRVFVGHTPQPLGNVLDVGYLVCMDTYCFGRGYLTAMNIDTSEIIQVDYFGHPRRTGSSALVKWLARKWADLKSLRREPDTPAEAPQVIESVDRDPVESEELDEVSTRSPQLEQNGVP